MRLRACLLAIAVVVPLRAFAQTPPPAAPPAPPPAPAPEVMPAAPPAAAAAPPTVVIVPPPAPAPAPVTAAPSPLKLTWNGLVDTYWMYLFNPATGLNSLTPPVGRQFDTNSNSFTLAMAKVSLNAAVDMVSFQLDMGYGADGTIINAANTGVPTPAGAMAPAAPFGGSFIVEQAYGTVSLPGNLSLDFGKFFTSAGAEVIDANKNWLYSRSFLFAAIPLLHTGVRANLKVNDQLLLQASLVNGWNNDPDNNAWKTIGLMATFTPNPMTSITLDTYFGKEGNQVPATATSTPGDLRLLIDAVLALTLNDKFGLNLNVDYIKAPDNVSGDYQIGAALMGKYTINDHVYVAARGEFLRTTVSVYGMSASTTVEEGTIMAGLPVGKNFELRPEVRGDFSGDNLYAGLTKKNQFTGTLAALTFF